MKRSLLITLACLHFVYSRSVTDPKPLPVAAETNGLCSTVRCTNGTVCRLLAPLDCKGNCELLPKCVPNTCPPNQELQSCGSACEETCDQPVQACSMQCVPNVCRCKAGYVKDSIGNCVLKSQCNSLTGPVLTCATMKCREGYVCSQIKVNCFTLPCPQPPPQCVKVDNINSTDNHICPANEYWSECGNLCEEKCGEPLKICPAACIGPGVCTCQQGFVRKNGVCISVDECKGSNSTANKTCPANEVWNKCGNMCEPKCGEKFKACPAICMTNGACTCAPEYYRHNGVCVPEIQCPAADVPGSSCALVDCMAGTRCVEETVQCFTTPCPPIAKCIPIVTATCDTVKIKCAENHGCEMVDGRPQCVYNGPSSCAATLCAYGSQCIEEPLPCLVAPCPTRAKCVANSNDTAEAGTTCAATSCLAGFECIEETPPCFAPPCPTMAKCVQNSGITCANVRIACKDGEQCGMVNGSPSCVKACGMNETFQECGTHCEPRCGEPVNKMCILSCNPSCQCNPGYIRNASNACVLTTDCGLAASNDSEITCANVDCRDGFSCSMVNGTPQCFEMNERCGKNEIFSNCTGCESTCDNQDPICTLECGRGCTCAPGYVRNSDGHCVTYDQCESLVDTDPLCGPNEKYTDCMPSCESNCRGDSCNTNGTITTTQCVPGCACKKFYKRDPNGTCQHTQKCYKYAQCGKNEKWSHCRPCEQTCATPGQTECTKKCHQGCACKPGFARNNDGDCVDEDLGCL